jgi:hypothetical protein
MRFRGLLFAAALLVPATAHAAAPVSVGPAQLLLHQPPFGNLYGTTQVACASTALCVGVTDGGVVSTSADAFSSTPSWTDPRSIDPGLDLNDVDCPSATLCVAVDSAGNALVATDPTGTWTSTAIDAGNDLTRIACRPTLCAAIDDNHSVVIGTIAAGAVTWAAPVTIDATHTLTDIACAPTGPCIAGDDAGQAISNPDPAMVASVWTTTAITHAGVNAGAVRAISCASSTTCGAVDAGRIFMTQTANAPNPTWVSHVDPGNADAFVAISCAASTLCVAITPDDFNITNTANAATPTYGTGGFTSLFAGDASSVTCVSATACLAAGGGRTAATTNASAAGTTWGYAEAIGQNTLVAGTCASADFCAAVDSQAHLVVSHDASTVTPHWTVTSPFGAGFAPSDLSCLDTSLCFAVSFDGQVALTANPTAGSPTWTTSSVAVGSLSQGTCSTAGFCVAVGDNGVIAATTDPTAAAPTWVTTTLPDTPSVLGISCVGTSLCLASTNHSEVAISTDPAAASPTWTEFPSSQAAIFGVACPSIGLCLAFGSDGALIKTTDPTAATPTWSAPQQVGDSNYLSQHLTCPSTAMCLAQDGKNVYASSNPTADTPTWTTIVHDDVAPGGDFIGSVGCARHTPCLIDGAFDTASIARGHTIDVDVGAGGGSVSGDDGLACPGPCEAFGMDGSSVTLTATPDDGYRFAGWTGACSGTSACAITLGGDETAGAVFEQIPPPVLAQTPPVIAPPLQVAIATPPPIALSCDGLAIRILDVHRSADKVVVAGIALPQFAGQKVTISASSKKAQGATATVQTDGTFSATVALPPSSVRKTVRYAAKVAGRSAAALKLERQFEIVSTKRTSKGLQVVAHVAGAKRGTTVTLKQQVSCSRTTTTKTARIGANGNFTVVLPGPTGTTDTAFYRAVAKLKGGTTYTLPIVVRR